MRLHYAEDGMALLRRAIPDLSSLLLFSFAVALVPCIALSQKFSFLSIPFPFHRSDRVRKLRKSSSLPPAMKSAKKVLD